MPNHHPQKTSADSSDKNLVTSIQWINDHIRIIDQTYLPEREVFQDIYEVGRVWEAIHSLRLQGAPAIGIAAAYGVYLGMKEFREDDYWGFESELKRICDYLASSCTTTASLQWVLNRATKTAFALREKPVSEIKLQLLNLARTIHEEDKRICTDIGKSGMSIIPENAEILTHGNTGCLATSENGTALSIIYHAHFSDKKIHVWVGETRPVLQGSRLTSWELLKSGVDHHVIADSMAGWVMRNKKVDLVMVGADRIAQNGDLANNIGTYGLAVLARHHGIPFYVAAPLSTIDLSLPSGEQIPIEVRDSCELRMIGHYKTAPDKTPVYNPALDVTPNELITAFITEKGIVKPDFTKNLAALLH